MAAPAATTTGATVIRVVFLPEEGDFDDEPFRFDLVGILDAGVFDFDGEFGFGLDFTADLEDDDAAFEVEAAAGVLDEDAFVFADADTGVLVLCVTILTASAAVTRD